MLMFPLKLACLSCCWQHKRSVDAQLITATPREAELLKERSSVRGG